MPLVSLFQARRVCLALTLFVFLATPMSAQPPAALLAEGWTALGQGQLARAAQAAQRAMADSPRSAAALALAVEVEIARGGAIPALDTYERWLGAKRIDEAYVLRRIAHAHLRGAARQGQGAARLEAVKALAAEGDPQAGADLMREASGGPPADPQVLASLGDERAVQALIAQLRVPGGSKVGVLKALVESRSRLAVPAIADVLADAREEHRAAAADALGRLGAPDAAARLRPLLEDPAFPVRVAAAGALYRLGDNSGVALLEQLLASEHAAVRLGAADAMSARPTPAWHAVVRELTRAGDATVQLGAARLIAPYDHELASTLLQQLGRSDNPAIREEAGRTFVERVAGDFRSLRAYLRGRDAVTAVRAAARILELTR